MTLQEMIGQLNLKEFNIDDASRGAPVRSAYCGDLLSDVMAHVQPDSVWFTIQGHLNSIAVAQLKDVLCIVLVNGNQPDAQALEKARAQKINICGSDGTSADLCMKLAGKIDDAA